MRDWTMSLPTGNARGLLPLCPWIALITPAAWPSVSGLGKFDFLDCGDLTWNIENALVCPQNTIGPIDLYQVTHHGLDISNNPVLVRSIQPTVAIMNNGPRKGGSPATVKLLRSIPSIKAAYQLHRNAQTSSEDNADPSLIANSDPAGGQFIHVSVTPEGSKFTVQIGPDGQRSEYASR